MSIKIISYTTKKLIIQNPSISEGIKSLIRLIQYPIYEIFIFGVILILLIYRSNVLDRARLNCYRSEEEISCILTGSNFYGKVEKLFSTRNGNIIKEAKIMPYYSDEYEALLIIKTTRQEFILSTHKEIVHEQEARLNTFLKNPTVTELYIVMDYQWIPLKLICFLMGILTFKICRMDGSFINIFSSVNYIFDKSNGELIIQKAFWKFLPNNPPTNIPLHKIKKIYLQEKKNYSDGELIFQDIRISLYGNSKLLSINLMVSNNVELNEAHKIASFICEFLQLEPYKTIEIPP
ncbi:hypothetical protein [Pseudanabaena sp. ABRG5-3]|uniref:hypothetical protein n=1 Tax=Pseudanabaena sp. ABRG5-3 TaxID=685565 RepID=UPI000DC6D31C|nr:hypothetical protein [Pseudanabaena sp. ABRG5-3]BBC26846.1 hypothetical protein ABRG53_c007 [Pseudanabaena sp. ABRG5-3]